jgi:hypothetical protein
MRESKTRTKLQLGSLKGRDHSENVGVDDRIILKWIWKKKF